MKHIFIHLYILYNFIHFYSRLDSNSEIYKLSEKYLAVIFTVTYFLVNLGGRWWRKELAEHSGDVDGDAGEVSEWELDKLVAYVPGK